MAGGGATAPGPWIKSELPLVVLDPAKKDLWLVPPPLALWPPDVQLITVQVTYEDPENNLKLRPDLNQFTGPDPQKVRLVLADPSKQRVGYQAIFYGAQTVSAPPSRTEDSLLRLTPGMGGRDVALLRPDPKLFSGGRVTRAVAKVRRAEAGADEPEQAFTFQSADDVARFAYEFAKSPGFSCKVTYSFAKDDPLTRRFTVTGLSDFTIPLPQRS
jgi:hypothetical protein